MYFVNPYFPIIVSVLVTLLCYCAPASASEYGIPTYHCIGLTLPKVLSASPSTTAAVRFRRTDSDRWHNGQPLNYDQQKKQFVGSIVDLHPGTTYSVEIRRPGDLDGPVTVQISTLPLPLPISEILKHSSVLHVSEGGSDSNPGTVDHPMRTIQHAVDLVSTGIAVVVHAGVYTEQIKPHFPHAGNPPVVIAGAEGESAVIDGEGIRDHAIELDSLHDIRIQNLVLRNTRRSLIRATNSRGVVLTSNTLVDPGGHYYDSAIEIGPGCADTVINGNTISFMNHTYSGGGMGIALRNTAGHHIIFQNRIIGNGRVKDGIGGQDNFGIQGGPYRDSDIYDNTISGCRDDAIESEGGGINIRIWGNGVSDSLVGIALAPVIKGPTYVWRNFISNCGPAFKLGEGDHLGHGPVFLYHNTAWSTGTENGGYAGSGGKGLFEHVTGRNNLIVNSGLVFYDRRKSATNSFDFDLLYPMNPKRFLEWGSKGSKMSLDDAKAMGYWVHGIVANPKLSAPPANFSLSPDSPAIDAGTLLPNFNDDYSGSAPDIGAIESTY